MLAIEAENEEENDGEIHQRAQNVSSRALNNKRDVNWFMKRMIIEAHHWRRFVMITEKCVGAADLFTCMYPIKSDPQCAWHSRLIRALPSCRKYEKSHKTHQKALIKVKELI